MRLNDELVSTSRIQDLADFTPTEINTPCERIS